MSVAERFVSCLILFSCGLVFSAFFVCVCVCVVVVEWFVTVIVGVDEGERVTP